MDLHSSLREIKGVGEKTEQLFQKIGVYTLGDILLHFPRTYQEYPQPEDPDEENIGQIVAVCGSLRTPAIFRRGKRMDITLASLFCKNQVVECVWFHMPYIAKQLQVGQPYIFYGRLLKEKQGYKMEQPAIFTPEKYLTLRDSLQPIYSLTKGMTQQMVRKLTLAACDSLADYSEENLPDFVEQREGFPSYMQAIRQVHFPMHFEALAEGRRRLVYQEFFYFILHSRILEAGTTGIENPWHFTETALTDETIQKLPYTLTKGQMDTLSQIRSDLQGPYVSQRLIQGDVGSGKTIVAFLAMLDVVASGYQAAIMAPTEVLAMQHAAGFREMCADYGLPYQVVCLTGSMTASQKKKAYEIIATIPQIFVVGTHALIQEKVDYLNLALVVTDEQHRFGVKQRESLSKKGMTPHMLVMSATPIPRTLAMILYGNMQISAIHELPADRIPIKTCVIKEDLRQKAYEMIGRELAGGHQAYIICPLVEASEQTEAENVTDYVERIRPIFGAQVSIAALHGKMPPKEKNAIMQAFAEGKTQILVSTTVVEVGVNVPNATLIMIEDANRFGLAQLHQLRGRVGRGKWQSYCILMDKSKGKKMTDRLEVMHKSNDGFFIAQEDLRLRGPGDFFGIRQSGELGFRLADIIGDADLLQKASQDVADFLKEDESLENYPTIRKNLSSFASDNNMIL